jgi:heme exporter protein A
VSAAAPPRERAGEAHALEKHFGPLVALRPLDLAIPRGTTLALLGPNGAGKSTLLRLLAGLARPSGGRLAVGGASVGRTERRRRVGLLGHATFLYPALTARENLLLAARLWGLPDGAARAARWLAELDLEAVADRRVGSFSRGTAQRLAIARALLHDPPVVLLDEPFTGLDPRAAARLADGLGRLRGARTSVLVTHELGRAAELADAALVLVAGFAVPLPAEALRSSSALETAYRAAVAHVESRLAGGRRG